jgi:acyl-CoA thioester hydrolase
VLAAQSLSLTAYRRPITNAPVLDPRSSVPAGAVTSAIEYRVPFYDTDAMAIVHHANYVRYLELVRVRFLQEHDQPYGEYVKRGYHVVVTRVEVALKRPTRFDEVLRVTCWLERVRNATLAFGYQIHNAGQLTLTGGTEHGVVNLEGRPVRMPEARRDRLRALLASSASP